MNNTEPNPFYKVCPMTLRELVGRWFLRVPAHVPTPDYYDSRNSELEQERAADVLASSGCCSYVMYEVTNGFMLVHDRPNQYGKEVNICKTLDETLDAIRSRIVASKLASTNV